MKKKNYPRRNEIYMAELAETGDSVQYGRRPVLIVQNDVGNQNSTTTVVAPLTSRGKNYLPTHVEVGPESGLPYPSTVLCEQLVTVSIGMLEKKMGKVTDPQILAELDRALRCSLGL